LTHYVLSNVEQAQKNKTLLSYIEKQGPGSDQLMYPPDRE